VDTVEALVGRERSAGRTGEFTFLVSSEQL